MAFRRALSAAVVFAFAACGGSAPFDETPAEDAGTSNGRSDAGSDAGGEPPPPAVDAGPFTYRASPVIVRTGVFDANETTNCGFGGGCVNAFFYFAAAPSVKSGDLPATLDGVETYDTTAWASNFQGPNRYPNESARVQWEWSIDNTESATAPRYLGKGECAQVRAEGLQCFEAIANASACSLACVLFEHSGACECSDRLLMDNAGGAPAIKTTWGKQQIAQVSARVYPLVLGVETVSSPDAFTTMVIEVMEDDEGLANDVTGSFEVDRRGCKDVFASGKARGWSSPRTFQGNGTTNKDIAFVDYKLWCERR